MHRIIDKGHALLKSKHPGDALFGIPAVSSSGAPPIAAWSRRWPASGLKSQRPRKPRQISDLLTDLLRAAQRRHRTAEVDVL